MPDRFFIDTNILVYANDRSDKLKQQVAREIIREAYATRCGVLSTQVLEEFFVAVTRKAGVPWQNARAQMLRLRELDVVVVDPDIIIQGVDLTVVHNVSFWDALIVKSAAIAGCRLLYTEDLAHGQVVDGVRIENPFQRAP